MGDGKLTPAVYTAWDDGEPNNSDGNENCGILRKTSHWNDDVCHKPGLFICEKQDDENKLSYFADEWYWIALSDMENEGTWVWMGDGKLTPAVYTAWDDGEPNNSHDNENCGVLRDSHHWNDYMCHQPGFFICEKQD
ncbi:CD209-like protein, partial [Mya arenaria]